MLIQASQNNQLDVLFDNIENLPLTKDESANQIESKKFTLNVSSPENDVFNTITKGSMSLSSVQTTQMTELLDKVTRFEFQLFESIKSNSYVDKKQNYLLVLLGLTSVMCNKIIMDLDNSPMALQQQVSVFTYNVGSTDFQEAVLETLKEKIDIPSFRQKVQRISNVFDAILKKIESISEASMAKGNRKYLESVKLRSFVDHLKEHTAEIALNELSLSKNLPHKVTVEYFVDSKKIEKANLILLTNALKRPIIYPNAVGVMLKRVREEKQRYRDPKGPIIEFKDQLEKLEIDDLLCQQMYTYFKSFKNAQSETTLNSYVESIEKPVKAFSQTLADIKHLFNQHRQNTKHTSQTRGHLVSDVFQLLRPKLQSLMRMQQSLKEYRDRMINRPPENLKAIPRQFNDKEKNLDKIRERLDEIKLIVEDKGTGLNESVTLSKENKDLIRNISLVFKNLANDYSQLIEKDQTTNLALAPFGLFYALLNAMTDFLVDFCSFE